MSEGFQFLDIVLFAMVAVFLALRLRSVLGKRTGHHRQRSDPLSQGRPPAPVDAGPEDREERGRMPAPETLDSPPQEERIEPEPDDEVAFVLTRLSILDETFERQTFMEGARAAFDLIVNAFAKGDLDVLRDMLAEDVFQNFADAIAERRTAGETLETTIMSLKSARIVDAELTEEDAVITVSFVSEQINITRDEEGRIVGGDPHEMMEITDVWSFRRKTRSRDPNWTLVETRSET